MNLSEWRKLTSDQRNEVWPTLTHADRDAIIETDKNVLTRLHPSASDAVPVLHTPVATAPAGPLPSSRSPAVTAGAVLSEVRSRSCYASLRGFALVLAILGYLAAGTLFVFALAADPRSGPSTGALIVASMVSVLATTAGYQRPCCSSISSICT
jgi:hypothetical protein